MSFGLRDAQVKETAALPNGAATIYSTGLDLGPISGPDRFLPECESEIAAPAVTTAMLGDAATIKYSIQAAVDSAFTSPVLVAADVLTQTGAGGAGAAAATARFRLIGQSLRYVRIRAINSAAGNASTVSLTHRLVF
jgi:hypothetical protein